MSGRKLWPGLGGSLIIKGLLFLAELSFLFFSPGLLYQIKACDSIIMNLISDQLIFRNQPRLSVLVFFQQEAGDIAEQMVFSHK